MGVRGLKTVLEKEKKMRYINIANEVKKWKKSHPGKKPIIVIDFLCLANSYGDNIKDALCGGRHQIALSDWTKMLDALKATESTLVFFSDLNIQEGKVDEWLSRRDREFVEYTKFYNSIDSTAVSQMKKGRRAISSTFYQMAVIAQDYGQFNYSIRRECDLEIARFATNNNAMAIISNDNDFLIFNGNWRLWSSEGMRNKSQRLKTIEFDRKSIPKLYSLAKHQLPLFATLLGNDFINFIQLAKFHKRMGAMEHRVKNVATYVRKVGRANLTNADIKQIAKHVFGENNEKLDHFERLIRESIDSYNTNVPRVHIDDPLELKLLNTRMYRPYMTIGYGIQGATMCFYDMRGPGSTFPMLLIDWIKRKKGILKRNTNDSFLLLAKKKINEKFRAHTETMICPDFALPSLDELYVGNGDDSKIIDIKWKLLAWIMLLSDDEISLIKNLPKDFLMISTTLFVLVKNKLIGTAEADGILHTECMVLANTTSNVQYPVALNPEYVRAAHIYNITFEHVRQNFSIAGLLPHIQELLKFDGKYFQKLMERITSLNTHERDNLFNPIKKYRIYDNII
ncbi:uncharacterized protein LOC129573544 [Sitodiplosis mosellana]|uniref:uncharacterized protein LOC129573544 n=1 Tax=Sitodiplosis mosellana TaxID=263140 RepID=UPI002443866B|nr:uncharacterized protein LOC129573544 [Sitodiplosis mosellana]